MTVVATSSADCGNSPRNAMLRDFCLAVAASDNHTISSQISDDARWSVSGGEFLQGKAGVLHGTGEIFPHSLVTFHLQTAITHGREGAAHGSCTYHNGTSAAWCFVVTFTSPGKSGLIREIRSFVIAEHNDQR